MPTFNTIKNSRVAAVFNAYPAVIREHLLSLRTLILDVATSTPGVGVLEETLKWGQPSYIAAATKSGSLIRIDQIKSNTDMYAMFFHCQTDLVDTFKEQFRNKFVYEDNRALLFRVGDALPRQELELCISLALTYHLRKKSQHTLRQRRG